MFKFFFCLFAAFGLLANSTSGWHLELDSPKTITEDLSQEECGQHFTESDCKCPQGNCPGDECPDCLISCGGHFKSLRIQGLMATRPTHFNESPSSFEPSVPYKSPHLEPGRKPPKFA